MSDKKKLSAGSFRNKMGNMTDTNLLLTITVVIFFAMYIGAIVFQGKGFLKPQTFFNILNANAALIIIACGMSIVMITGGIDISVGGVAALVSMCCAVHLDHKGGNVIGAIGIDPDIDFEVPDVEESLNWFQKIIKAIKDFFAWIGSWFK